MVTDHSPCEGPIRVQFLPGTMDRQQLFALLMVFLMVFSSVAYAAATIF